MNKPNRNERKIQVLTILNYATHPYTAKEIAELCPVSLSCISGLLKRYVNQTIVERKKKNGVFVYKITNPRGIERLEYLLGTEKINDLLVREAIKF